MGLFDLFKNKKTDAPAAPAPEVQSLVARLGDPDPKARIAACKALGALGPRAQSAVPILSGLIDDDDGDVCNAAAAALSAIER